MKKKNALSLCITSTQLIRPRKSSESRYYFSFSGIVNTTLQMVIALGYLFKISGENRETSRVNDACSFRNFQSCLCDLCLLFIELMGILIYRDKLVTREL